MAIQEQFSVDATGKKTSVILPLKRYQKLKVIFKPSVEKDLSSLPRSMVARVFKRIEGLKADPFPRRSIKLAGAELLYRIRSHRSLRAASTRRLSPTIRKGRDSGLFMEYNMTGFTDSLRGYAYNIHKRDNFTCRYCGVNGSRSFDTWLTLTVDHLLPKGHPDRDNPDYMVTACSFCNTADNRYFDLAEQRGLQFAGLTADELVRQRLPFVQRTRRSYREFWETQVISASEATP